MISKKFFHIAVKKWIRVELIHLKQPKVYEGIDSDEMYSFISSIKSYFRGSELPAEKKNMLIDTGLLSSDKEHLTYSNQKKSIFPCDPIEIYKIWLEIPCIDKPSRLFICAKPLLDVDLKNPPMKDQSILKIF